MACTQYRVDLTASFGTCVCGYKKLDHKETSSTSSGLRSQPSQQSRVSAPKFSKPSVSGHSKSRTPPPVTKPRPVSVGKPTNINISKPKVNTPTIEKKPEPGPCSNYRVDLTASFGTCVCGFKRNEHSESGKNGSGGIHHINTSAVLHREEAKPASKDSTVSKEPKIESQLSEPEKSSVSTESSSEPLTVAKSVLDCEKQTEPAKSRYKALYEFKSSRQGDLSFEAGEILSDVETKEGGWWFGVSQNGNKGLFPKDYVQIYTEMESKKDEIKANVVKSHKVPNEDGENTVAKMKATSKDPNNEPARLSIAELQQSLALKENQLAAPKDHKNNSPALMRNAADSKVHTEGTKLSAPKTKPKSELQPVATSPQGSIPKRQFQGLYDFDGDVSQGDLPFKEGEIITLVEEIDEDWIKCKNTNGNSGICPIAYVKEIPNSPKSPKEKPKVSLPKVREARLPSPSEPTAEEMSFMKALFDFPSDQEGDIEMNVNDILLVKEEVDESWLKGENLSKPNGKNSIGIFPKAYATGIHQTQVPTNMIERLKNKSSNHKDSVKKEEATKPKPVPPPPRNVNDLKEALFKHKSPFLEPEKTSLYPKIPEDLIESANKTVKAVKKSPLPPPAGRANVKVAKALFDFPGEQPGDIKMKTGDIVVIIEDVDDSWWKGRVVSGATGKESIGIFPKNFASIVATDEVPEDIMARINMLSIKEQPPPPPVRSDKVPIASIPPPPPSSTSKEIRLVEGRSVMTIPRSFKERGSVPPPAPWYSTGDTYSCRISLQKGPGGTKKIEEFTISKTDRTRVHLTVEQIQRESNAKLVATVTFFKPLPEEVLNASATCYGPAIVAYAESRIGSRDGNGECWTLGANALKHAGTQAVIGFNFGQEIRFTEVKPGDILQFKECRFVSARGTKTAGAPDHTAVVRRKLGPNVIEVLEQNPNPVSIGTYDLSQLVSGTLKAFRPLPKDEEISNLLSRH